MPYKRVITAADILPMPAYAARRGEWRRDIGAVGRLRRVDVGPWVSFHFENWQTLWLQVQEMLHIERGGAAQVPDELAAYNPLVPNGRELVATMMIGVDEAHRRRQVLGMLGGIEATAFIEIAGQIVRGVPEGDPARTAEQGKASAVQFVHFCFAADESPRSARRQRGWYSDCRTRATATWRCCRRRCGRRWRRISTDLRGCVPGRRRAREAKRRQHRRLGSHNSI